LRWLAHPTLVDRVSTYNGFSGVAARQSIRDNPYLKRTLRCRRLAQRDERRAGGPLPRVPASDSAIARATEANAAC